MKRPVSTRDKFASKRKQKRVSNTRRAVSAELSICAAPLSVRFCRRRTFWAKFHFRLPFGVKLLPPCLLTKFYLVSAFLSIVPTSTTASFGVKFHRRAQSVFNRAVCFVVKFYCRPRSVQSPLVYRKTPARNKARPRSTARLLPCRRRAANFKI